MSSRIQVTLDFERCICWGITTSGLLSAGYGPAPDFSEIKPVGTVHNGEWFTYVDSANFNAERAVRKASESNASAKGAAA